MKKTIAVFATLAFMATPAAAGSPALDIKADSNLKNVTLTISGPDGYQQTSNALSGTPVMMSDNGAPMADGVYSWEMTGSTGKRIVTAKHKMNNGRGDAQRSYSYETVTYSGSFTIENGVQVDTSLVEK